MKKGLSNQPFEVLNSEQLEEINDKANPFKQMKNKIKLERLVDSNFDEVIVDQANHLNKLSKTQHNKVKQNRKIKNKARMTNTNKAKHGKSNDTNKNNSKRRG